MHKLTFSERRSARDRRCQKRRNIERRLVDLVMFAPDRRNKSRRGIWFRKATYTVYVSDRL